jgi:hypothetical protein
MSRHVCVMPRRRRRPAAAWVVFYDDEEARVVFKRPQSVISFPIFCTSMVGKDLIRSIRDKKVRVLK